jgi:hypothetical protein
LELLLKDAKVRLGNQIPDFKAAIQVEQLEV